MKATLCSLVHGVTVLALAAGALAAPPTKAPVPAAPFTLSGACAFDVAIDFPAQNEFAITFGDGTFLVAGQFKASLTNLATGKTLTLNVPGPGRYTPSADGLTIDIAGPWLVFWTTGMMGPGTPGGMLYTTGKGTVTASADGSRFAFTQKGGTRTDLCAALAG